MLTKAFSDFRFRVSDLRLDFCVWISLFRVRICEGISLRIYEIAIFARPPIFHITGKLYLLRDTAVADMIC